MEKINFKHSVIFFNFCILISPFYNMLNFEPIIVCLFLILILGISHGALDNIKGKKLLKLFGYKSIINFYLFYITISILIILFWLVFPNTVLFLFFNCCILSFWQRRYSLFFQKKFFDRQNVYFF